ncbi:unnamed protein product [Caenorhabditis angaria]|uniref:Uncharacterized protein n=1 Tax=Caenorhabditis angaria TaxID=860376 RepID=A0A9P1IB92_9PELO|nr:unnamed protein product [Caenorhabditis angaria]
MENLNDSGFDGRSSPPMTNNRPKRQAVESVAELDELLRSNLSLTKRRPEDTFDDTTSPVSSKNPDRPKSRRSNSYDNSPSQLLEQRRSLRVCGNNLKNIRHISALSTDSISPRSIQQMCSPRRKFPIESSNPYTKHRLGQTFSPMLTGAKKRTSILKGTQLPSKSTPSPSYDTSPIKSLRNVGELRTRSTLMSRLQNSQLE